MARNFMVNTVNTEYDQDSRLTLIETISRAASTEEVRQAYLLWQQAMEGDRAGAKRLPDFREKLFKVL
jgi:acyl-CoA-binding protein